MPRTNLSTSFEVAPPSRPIKTRPHIVGRNTFGYVTEDGREVIRLHLTDIAERDSKGNITLTSGGYYTVTTKDRINTALGKWGTGMSVYSHLGEWIVLRQSDGATVRFYDGIVLPATFEKRTTSERKSAKARKLRASINAFVKKTIPEGRPIPKPSQGDCWFCLMFNAEPQASLSGHTVQPLRRDTDHLLEHIKDGYMHGSLIVNAYRFAGVGEVGIAMTFDDGFRRDNKEVRRRVRRYLCAKLGLPT